jgi:hypothetical protein
LTPWNPTSDYLKRQGGGWRLFLIFGTFLADHSQ